MPANPKDPLWVESRPFQNHSRKRTHSQHQRGVQRLPESAPQVNELQEKHRGRPGEFYRIPQGGPDAFPSVADKVL